MGQSSALGSVGESPGKSKPTATSALQKSNEFEGFELVSLFFRRPQYFEFWG
jgi:hypothetical protein